VDVDLAALGVDPGDAGARGDPVKDPHSWFVGRHQRTPSRQEHAVRLVDGSGQRAALQIAQPLQLGHQPPAEGNGPPPLGPGVLGTKDGEPGGRGRRRLGAFA